ncbi:isocitrate lyase/PEP mutase family protein [Thermovirga lienii]|uniref:isocitrate lyase/PEP mutase family protein n=1 Tax=Thermovirga lienii TaxID=336261 RepID=UPI002FE0757E
MRKSATLRQLLKKPGAIVAPGVYDAISAKVCEIVGFEALQHSGYGTSAVTLGKPDVGFLTLSEMSTQVRIISRAVNIPVVGDGDNGFGNAINVTRTVEEYISAGAAGLFIEDQVIPKRCGHMEGKEVIPFEEMAGKLRAALDTRNEIDPDFVVIYRTDAVAVKGFDDAIERAKKAVDMGVDMIFIEAMETKEQIERAAEELAGVHLMLNLVEGGKTPLISISEAEAMGYKWVVPALSCLYSAVKGMFEVMREIRENGVSNNYKDKLVSFSEFAEILQLDNIRKMEEKYLPQYIIEAKYSGKSYVHIIV